MSLSVKTVGLADMEFLMTEATYKLLIILCMIQGTYGVLIHHNESVTAVEGQNVSLPCFVEEENEIKVIQLEWIKQQKENENDQKIVVVHHTMPEHYFQHGFLLTTMISSKTGKLQGSVLTLYKVAMKDSGNYICEITSYPNGSIKRTTKLQVTEPPASVEMSHPYGFIKEGDEVKITCSARPPPLHYTLGRSKDKLLWMKSLNGEFILPNVTRNNSDLYVCLPEWDSFGKNQQGLNTTVELTVNFLDGIECNTSSPLNVSFGEDVAIKCIAKASEYLHYKWMMGDTTLSLSDTLSLTSMTSNQSGTYKLTAVFQDNQLQTDIEFSIHVLSKSSEGLTTPSPVGITKHLRTFTSMGISSWNTGAIETTTESGHFLTSTSKPNATMTNLQQPRKTSHGTPLTGSTSAPPVGNASTLHASTVKSAGTSCTQNQSTSQDPLTGRNKVTSVITEKKLTTTVTTSKESKSAAYIAVPIVLLLLVLTALLYRKYLNQKKMDLPPPFKPPPPPVKYTSVRKYDVPMTDILV